MNALLLFDIDGTLVDSRGAGLGALEKGFFSAFPEREGESFPPLELGGATDAGIARFLFAHFGIEESEAGRERFFAAYALALRQRLRRHRGEGNGRLLPGVAALLEALGGGDFHPLGLLTGNTAAGARLKLEHFGIASHFAFGAYGDDHADRNLLGPVALERARRHAGRAFEPARTVVVGDTVKDIACARAFGAKVVAVATGAGTVDQLAAAGPDALLPDLSDSEAFLAALASIL